MGELSQLKPNNEHNTLTRFRIYGPRFCLKNDPCRREKPYFWKNCWWKRFSKNHVKENSPKTHISETRLSGMQCTTNPYFLPHTETMRSLHAMMSTTHNYGELVEFFKCLAGELSLAKYAAEVSEVSCQWHWQVLLSITLRYGPEAVRLCQDNGRTRHRVCNKAGQFLRERGWYLWRLEGKKICQFFVEKISHLLNHTAWHG